MAKLKRRSSVCLTLAHAKLVRQLTSSWASRTIRFDRSTRASAIVRFTAPRPARTELVSTK
jgi:hypothetical protein